MPAWAIQLIVAFAPQLISQLIAMIQAVITSVQPVQPIPTPTPASAHPSIAPLESALSKLQEVRAHLQSAADAAKQAA